MSEYTTCTAFAEAQYKKISEHLAKDNDSGEARDYDTVDEMVAEWNKCAPRGVCDESDGCAGCNTFGDGREGKPASCSWMNDECQPTGGQSGTHCKYINMCGHNTGSSSGHGSSKADGGSVSTSKPYPCANNWIYVGAIGGFLLLGCGCVVILANTKTSAGATRLGANATAGNIPAFGMPGHIPARAAGGGFGMEVPNTNPAYGI